MSDALEHGEASLRLTKVKFDNRKAAEGETQGDANRGKDWDSGVAHDVSRHYLVTVKAFAISCADVILGEDFADRNEGHAGNLSDWSHG